MREEDGPFSRKQFLQKETINLIFNRCTKEQGSDEEICPEDGVGTQKEDSFLHNTLFYMAFPSDFFKGMGWEIFSNMISMFSSAIVEKRAFSPTFYCLD